MCPRPCGQRDIAQREFFGFELGILTLGTGLAVRLMASARNAASRAVMRMPRSVIVVDIGEPPV
jgi:hypothetical protein